MDLLFRLEWRLRDASHRYGDKFFLSGKQSSLISPVHADRMLIFEYDSKKEKKLDL